MTQRPATPADLGALSHLAPELAQTLASVAGDIALVVDVDGVIRNVALGGGQPLPASAEQWVGRRWIETVSDETRGKVEMLLREAVDAGVSRRREVNLPLGGVEVPVAYAAVRLGRYGPVLAVGRDLRAVAAIQQRFTESQQQMEREYWKKRQAESRYRQLFQVATDAVLVLEAQTQQIVEANRAAARLFDRPPETLAGLRLSSVVDAGSRAGVEALLDKARQGGRTVEGRARLGSGAGLVSLSASPFRSDDALHLLVRARAADEAAAASTTFAELVARIPDGIVITDGGGRIVTANPAFIDLCRVADEGQIRGEPLARWLGAHEGELPSILAALRGHGIAPQLTVPFHAGDGRSFDVELSAALLAETEQDSFGFTLRPLAERSPAARLLLDELAHAVRNLSTQLGQAPLPGLLRQATELAERHFIVAAIDRSGGDPALAASLLGVSLHSLQLRLQRLGLGDDSDAGAVPE